MREPRISRRQLFPSVARIAALIDRGFSRGAGAVRASKYLRAEPRVRADPMDKRLVTTAAMARAHGSPDLIFCRGRMPGYVVRCDARWVAFERGAVLLKSGENIWSNRFYNDLPFGII